MLYPYLPKLHASPWQIAMAITGGGTLAISDFLTQPGGSATMLEAIVPYDRRSLANYLGHHVEQACNIDVARQLAATAALRAEQFVGARAHAVGIGCTAALVSTTDDQRDRRIHVARCGIRETILWSVQLRHRQRTRMQEERIAASMIHCMMAMLVGDHVDIELASDEPIQESCFTTDPSASTQSTREKTSDFYG